MAEEVYSVQKKGLPDVMAGPSKLTKNSVLLNPSSKLRFSIGMQGLPGPSTTTTPATSIFESRRLSIGRPRPPAAPGEPSQRRTGSIDAVRSAAPSRAGLTGLGGLQHAASLTRSGATAGQGVGLPKDFPALIEHLSRAAGSAAGNGSYAGAPNGLYNAPAAPVINLTGGGGGGGRRGAMGHGGSSVTQGQTSGPTPPRYRPGVTGHKGMGQKVQSFDNVGLALARSHLATGDVEDMQGGASDPWGAAHVHSGSCHGAPPPSGLYTLASHPSNGSTAGGGPNGASGESSARNSGAAPPSAGGRHTSSVYAFSPRGQLGWGANYAPPVASKLCADSNDPQRKPPSGGSSADSAIPPFGGEGYAYAAAEDAGPGHEFVGQGVAAVVVEAPSPLDSVDGIATPGLVHLASPRGGYPYAPGSAGPGRSMAQNTAGPGGSAASRWSAAPASSVAASTPAHSQGLGQVGGAARRGSDKPSRFRTSNMGQALATAATGAALPPSPAGGAVAATAVARRSAKAAAAPKGTGCFGFLFGFRR